MAQKLAAISTALAQSLKDQACRIVFAESCTAGLVSSTMAQIPGISEFLCGSAVVYRIDTKHRWLNVPNGILINPGPVSAEVAAAMCAGVLTQTPEADWSAAVTGHLGPNAPERTDGLIFIGIARRDENAPDGMEITTQQHWLDDPPGDSASSLRHRRQLYAAQLVLEALHQAIQRR